MTRVITAGSDHRHQSRLAAQRGEDPVFSRSKTPTDPVTVLVDGLQIQTNEAGRLAIEKLQQQLAETITAKDSVIESLRAENLELQTAKNHASGLADRAAQQAVELQRQMDQISAPAGMTDSSQNMDPVVLALRDRSNHRTHVNDNGYTASVAALDYRTRLPGVE